MDESEQKRGLIALLRRDTDCTHEVRWCGNQFIHDGAQSIEGLPVVGRESEMDALVLTTLVALVLDAHSGVVRWQRDDLP